MKRSAASIDKQKQAEAALPPALRDTFNALVNDYQDAALAHTGRLFVNYRILAELVLAGWRKVEKATHKSEHNVPL